MADSLIERLKRSLSDRFERTFSRAHMSGVCDSYTLDQVRDLLEHGASISRRAKTATAFVKYSDVLGSGGDKLADAAGKLDGLITPGKTTVGDVRAACEISDAIAVLNQWTVDGTAVSNRDAARAFDRLFGGVATFFERLPPPINQYSRVLSAIAEFKFFSHMQDVMDPASPNTPKGRALHEAMEAN